MYQLDSLSIGLAQGRGQVDSRQLLTEARKAVTVGSGSSGPAAHQSVPITQHLDLTEPVSIVAWHPDQPTPALEQRLGEAAAVNHGMMAGG
eukprot:2782335-Rhodomonas_salina.1